MDIILVAAVSEDGVIGNKGELPWKKIRYDLKHFQQLTTSHVVIMGSGTFESLGRTPLPDRINIVLSRKTSYSNVFTFNTLREALKFCVDLYRSSKVFIIGGGQLYAQTIAIATKMVITHLDVNCEGDTFFPPIQPSDWVIEKEVPFCDVASGISGVIKTYTRV